MCRAGAKLELQDLKLQDLELQDEAMIAWGWSDENSASTS